MKANPTAQSVSRFMLPISNERWLLGCVQRAAHFP